MLEHQDANIPVVILFVTGKVNVCVLGVVEHLLDQFHVTEVRQRHPTEGSGGLVEEGSGFHSIH